MDMDDDVRPGSSEPRRRMLTRGMISKIRKSSVGSSRASSPLPPATPPAPDADVPKSAHGPHCAHGNWLSLPATVSFEEAPLYMQDNAFLHGGYRVAYSFRECALSFFTQHNEMGNMWTHAIGALVFVVYILATWAWAFAPDTGTLPVPAWVDVALFSLYYFCALFCMVCSTLYHTFCSHSEASMLLFIRCDLSGIAALVSGSFYSPFYNVFYCRPWLYYVYMSIMSIFAVGGILGPQMPGFHSTSMRGVRAAVYGGMAGFGVLPILHSAFVLVWDDFVGFMAGVLLMYGCYGAGLVFYITRWPESRWPGKFDVWFNSHSLWHLFVLLGSLAHAYACWSAYLMRLNRECPVAA